MGALGGSTRVISLLLLGVMEAQVYFDRYQELLDKEIIISIKLVNIWKHKVL